jgi:LPS-assembly protein
MARLLILIATLVTLALPALAQDRATLVSDSLRITGDTQLIADAAA